MGNEKNIEQKLTIFFATIALFAIVINVVLIKGVSWRNILDSTKDISELFIVVIVFLVAKRIAESISYSDFKSIFERYLGDWVNQNRYLIDEVKRKEGKEGKEFYYMLTKKHHNNIATEEKLANEFDVNEGTVFHKGVFLYTDYRETEEITFGLNKSFFISGRGGDFPAPFQSLDEIAQVINKRLEEQFNKRFEYQDSSDAKLSIRVTDSGKRLHVSLKEMANTKENAKALIDMIEYVKTIIIAIA